VNNKVQIWKRKLAKEKWKRQKAVWEKLSNQPEPPTVTMYDYDFTFDQELLEATKTFPKSVSENSAFKELRSKFIKMFSSG